MQKIQRAGISPLGPPVEAMLSSDNLGLPSPKGFLTLLAPSTQPVCSLKAYLLTTPGSRTMAGTGLALTEFLAN